MLSQLPQTGFLRPLALVSPALTEATGGDRNIEWREIRWQRALEEIRKHPIVGVGYGGLENALISDIQSAEEGQDMDLATGGVHNGFIAVALALGIPAAILFLFILVRQMILNGFRAFSLRSRDPVLADAHAFVCANLLASVGGMFIGSDVNDPMIWFYFALGLVISQLRRAEGKKVVSAPSIDLPGLAGQPA
jgi:O-antigen ligase